MSGRDEPASATGAAQQRATVNGCPCAGVYLQYRAFNFARVAQLVEHLICNQAVGGSTPSAGSIHPCLKLEVAICDFKFEVPKRYLKFEVAIYDHIFLSGLNDICRFVEGMFE